MVGVVGSLIRELSWQGAADDVLKSKSLSCSDMVQLNRL